MHLVPVRFLLTTYYPHSRNAAEGSRFKPGLGMDSFWMINLQDKPFFLEMPLIAIGADGAAWDRNRVLGLWPLPLRHRH